MAGLKIEGDLDGVNEHQLKYIGSVLEQRGYTNETVLFEVVGKAGDNYVANVKRISVTKDSTTFKIIAKIAPGNEVLRMMGNTALMFNNEHRMYTEVLPKLADILKAAEVPDEYMLRYAACYGTCMEAPNEVILLEDLLVSDFKMLDRFKSLNSDTVKLVLKNFAILHSASFALKEQEPETFERFRHDLKSLWLVMCEAKEMVEMFGKFEDDFMQILDQNKYKNMLKGSLKNMTKYIKKSSDIDSKSRYTVILQGDPWTNNIMFRMEGDKPIQCCMIDYQISNVATPVGDILYLIFNCTDYETRSKHYHDWIDYYHSELEKSLSNFGLKANYVYPRDQLDAELRRYSKVSFSNAILASSVLIRETADAAKMKKAMEAEDGMVAAMEETKVSALDAKSIAAFKRRVEGIIDSFLELGYLTAN